MTLLNYSIQVGATYGRKTMTGLLTSQKIRVSEQRVGLALARINPACQQWRRSVAMYAY